ncbi:uncharacterized protein Z519_08557 [Cladophialophora bantiana CBS 173.52]|uniref:Amidohydrolase 3 domain-containing protein n=1 Tax=Cladophialophora bantiana (strain ATCC 10958 / CBS 173.52 / CDC B-1940 / NIH 8579) TaxID=1442370 RepID=A0A0D2I1I7_CLAB1|nr:uncharacterized protein Z519_08557 [Cladophialophora bantiana CBS 173.52]KIW90774.1 hypothetical protein Z519_08557 [Cladophialophora bantiana CBS 173.52]
MPGIHDAHVHIFITGLATLSNIKPGMDAKKSNITERPRSPGCVCEFADAYGDQIVTDLCCIDDYDRGVLDRNFPNTLVMLHGGASHAMFLNSATLNRIFSEEDALNSKHLRRTDWTLMGDITELDVTKAALALPQRAMDLVKRSITHDISWMQSGGVTSVQE